MIKNENFKTRTKKVKATEAKVDPINTVTEEESKEVASVLAGDFGYYSKLLNKPFDSITDLVKAEDEHREAIKAKEDAASIKKAKAAEIKETIKCRLEAEIVARDTKAEAYREYLDKCEEADKLVADRKAEEAAILEEWNKEYGAFRDEITVGDTNYMVTYKVNSDVPSASELFDRIFNTNNFFKIF